MSEEEKAIECLRFDAVWHPMSMQGMCDGLGGMEYLRVRRDWFDAGCPADLPQFITRRANIGSNEGK